MWHKNPVSYKTWENFNKVLAEEYHDLHELQRINKTSLGFHEANMAIIIKGNISKSLENLAMATTS